MNINSDNLVKWLFETNAIRVCPQNKPFWYTSGTIGPYFINTHFLYGSEEKANKLLKLIDAEKENIFSCPIKVLDETLQNYESDKIYRALIDQMTDYIKSNINIDEVDFISGGERRDWFFSLVIAKLLNKPHITIYKDMTSVISQDGKVEEVNNLNGKNVLHIADLITEASSYERAWIPAISNKGGNIKWSVVVVDRKQGGEKVLSNYNVKSFAMVGIDVNLFTRVLHMGMISDKQFEMIDEYMKNPKDSMARFLKENPDFIEQALNSDDKTKERAKLMLEKNIYEL
ncbi:phosphoribosyltransferase [Acetivibrio cellulolyticus]|uniref:phosphoribosyltransferase n=1 Tax=Acetivibrio cellulolyticus TaxID=35830 RepID=UPI0001E2D958|nr:phosphoribosyltransferase [Acetivibrio cellulolyticus]